MARLSFAKVKEYYRHNRRDVHVAGMVAAIIIIAGTVLIFVKAAGSVVSIQAESGTRSTQASVVSDSTASGSSAVKFTAAASQTAGCPVLPAFPDANCTGWRHTGVTLVAPTSGSKPGTNHGWHASGSNVLIDANNAVIDGLEISGSIVNTNGYGSLTIKNSWIRCIDEHSECINWIGQNSLVVDTEIGGGVSGSEFTDSIGVRSTGTSSQPNTLRRLDVHGQLSGTRPNGDTLVEDCYIHQMPMGDAIIKQDGSTSYIDHSGGSFIEDGLNVTFRHNHIVGGNSAALFVQDYDSSPPGIGNLLVENNYFENIGRNGENATWGVSIENKFIKGPITVQNNVFSYGWDAGPMLLPQTSVAHPLTVTYSGNKFTDGSVATPEFHAYQF